jgi:glycine hydroxymethyltransferase
VRTFEAIQSADPESYQVLMDELARQRESLILIASENYASLAVMAAAGTPLTNKYAEGYPGKRYYAGCEVIDRIETLAIERVKELFGCDHANVQPHSGSQANQAAYYAFLEPGATIMGMDLSHGGHLTHGSPVNISGKHFHFISYGVDRETETLDYDRIREQAEKVRPAMIMTGASAYPREIDFQKFSEIAKSVGAILVADIAHVAGLVAAKIHPDPVPCCDVVTSTTHKTLRGPRSGMILCREEHAKRIDRGVFPFLQGGPLMHIILAKAVAFGEALKPEFRIYQQQIVDNAKAMAQALIARGIRLISGGTDNHLFLIDLRESEVDGKTIQDSLERAGIVTSRSMVPYDHRKPYYTSGVRIGTPSVTTRGMKEPEMARIADWIVRGMENYDNLKVLDSIRSEVRELCAAFPLYPEW